jgi:hypothetical protein
LLCLLVEKLTFDTQVLFVEVHLASEDNDGASSYPTGVRHYTDRQTAKSEPKAQSYERH